LGSEFQVDRAGTLRGLEHLLDAANDAQNFLRGNLEYEIAAFGVDETVNRRVVLKRHLDALALG
jgi:hypothetical protein